MGYCDGIVKRPSDIENEKKMKLKKDLHDLKEQLVFKLLENSNIDLQAFMNSPLYNNPNNYSLIEHIYGKLYGYDFYYALIWTNKKRKEIMIAEKKDQNGHIMDLENVKFIFANNTLTLSDGSISLKYKVDKHCIIYMNGKDLNISNRVLTEDEKKRARKEFHENLESYRNRTETALIKSKELAKSCHVKSGQKPVKK